MNPGAGVHALDALKEWYAALAEFRTDANNGLTSVALSLQRAGDWLLEQQQHWQRQIRKAEEEVVQARTELRNRKYEDWSGRHPDTTVQEENLEKALTRLEFCHDRLDATRRWMGRLPNVIQDVYDGPGRRLGFFLDTEMPRALAQLAGQLGALDQYVNLAPVAAPQAAPPPADARSGKEPS